MPLLFFILWIILNGRVTLEIVLFGLVISMGIAVLSYKAIRYTPELDANLFRNFFRLIRYAGVLIVEIIKAAFSVIRFSLDPKKKPDPVIVEFHSGLSTNRQNVLLANSITLTPGTYTLFQEGDHFVVHCLSSEFSEGMEDLVFIKLLKKMEV